ncbi:MAG: oligosaccharide flippase family protein [Thermoleophilaceae bacterium]|nr:oligosaccharide flippase family protein [Thermoleophilaceae bacterium]
MRDRIAALGKQTVVYGLSGVAIQMAGVVTLPVFARVFTTAEYGVLEVGTVGLGMLVILVDLGMASASQRSFFDYTDEQEHERRAVLFTALALSGGASLLVAAGIIAAREPVADWLFDGQGYSTVVVLLAVALPVTILAQFFREILRLRFRPWPFFWSSMVGAIAGTVVSVVGVTTLDLGLDGAVLGPLVGAGVAAVYGGIAVRGEIGRRLSRPELGVMLRYGIPLIPTAVALWALSFIDRLMLSQLSDLGEVGEYGVANRISTPLLFGVVAFATAFAPFMLAGHAEDQEMEKRVRGRAFTFVALGLALLGLILALFARELIAVVAPEFDTAYQAVGLLSLGLVAYGLSSVAMSGIALKRRTGYFALYSLVAAAVNVALNFLVIPPFGMIGAAFATLVAYVLLLCLYYRKSQQLYPTPYQPWRVLGAVVLAAALMPLGAAAIEPLALAVVLKLAALALYLVALRATGVVTADDVTELRRLTAWRPGRGGESSGSSP